MAERTREESVFDWLALLGILVASVGWFFANWVQSGNFTWADGARALGLAIFLGSVFAAMRVLLRRTETSRSEIQKGLEGLRSDLISRTDRLSSDLRREITGLRDEHTVLATYRDILDFLGGDDSVIHVRAAGETLRQVVADHVPSSAATLKRFQQGEPEATIELKDHSPIFDLMRRLASGLPPGSIWLGITHLDNVDAWEHPLDQAFEQYQEFTRDRAEKGELLVARLFCFRAADEEKLRKMTRVMEREAHSGISVRALQAQELPPDISLLYLPPPRQANGPLTGLDPTEDLLARGYRPLCVLSYTLAAGQYVQNLSIHAGTSDWFRRMRGKFVRSWRRGRELASRDITAATDFDLSGEEEAEEVV